MLHLALGTLLWAAHARPDAPAGARRASAAPGRAEAVAAVMDARVRRTQRAGARVVSDYFEMTKPRVQSLLLFTTVTTMYVAGDPSLGLVALTCLGGALSAGGAGAINHVLDRDIDRKMQRTANRPVASGRVSPARRRWPSASLLGVAAFVLLAATVNLLAAALALSGPARLRVRLHALAEALDAAEHRDRRRRGRGAAAGGLGGRDRRARPARRCTCSRSSSSGRRRTSGRCRS